MPPVRRSSRNPRKQSCTAFANGKKGVRSLVKKQMERVMQRIDDEEAAEGGLKYGRIQEIVAEEKHCMPWLTYNSIMSQRSRRKKAPPRKKPTAGSSQEGVQVESVVESATEELATFLPFGDRSNRSSIVLSEKNQVVEQKKQVGRKKGSTNKAKETFAFNLERMKDDCALTKMIYSDYSNNLMDYELQGLKRGMYFEAEDESKVGQIPSSTIRARIMRYKKNGGSGLVQVVPGPRSPLADLEPVLCCLLKMASRLGNNLSQSDTIAMANELIQGTVYEQRLIDWKKKNNPATKIKLRDDPDFVVKPDVSFGWYRGFCKRYPEIEAKRSRNVKHYRTTWSTYAMLDDMYSLVYELFYKWGLSRKLDEPHYQDMNGRRVSKENALGCLVEYELIHPDRILTMDETGDKGNQSEETSTGEKYLCERGDGGSSSTSIIAPAGGGPLREEYPTEEDPTEEDGGEEPL